MSRRRLGLLLVAAAGMTVALSAATAGGSYVAADRSATVNLAPNEAAYFGVDTRVVRADPGGANGSGPATRVKVTLENRFDAGASLDTVVRAGNQYERVQLEAGDTAVVTVPGARCGQRLQVQAQTPDSGLFVETTRAIPCPAQGPPG
jgi:hypothetical protein